jgi:NADH-quinone oxidoreductase subunit E
MDNLIAEIIEKHKEDKNCIAIMQSLQEALGFIPETELSVIARSLDIPLAKFYGVATFYSQFRLRKSGKYLIQLCNGTACHVNGSQALIEFLREYLKVKEGSTTEDGLFTFELVHCIGACAKAPSMMINGSVYGNLTTEKIKKIVEDYKKNG